VEITWFGEGCVRLRGREGTVAADAYRSVVGPTGRGLTADVATYSHADPQPVAPTRKAPSAPSNGHSPFPAPASVVRPASLESAFPLEVPGEYEIHDILVTGVRTYRDDAHGAERGENVAFVYQLDGLNTVHLGDIGHLLDEEMLGEIGTAEMVCVPIGGALAPARAAELVAQLDAKLVIPLTVALDEAAGNAEMAKFLHEMGAAGPTPQPRLTVSVSSIPEESTVIVLESRARS
jgi:L-ascorbate metabolism protein UlaG (beta-lactamase superfamily)